MLRLLVSVVSCVCGESIHHDVSTVIIVVI